MNQRHEHIIKNNTFIKYINKIGAFEKDRVFCKHNLSHFLNVARIAYILTLENKIDLSKEIVYAAGLLHDIGKVLEYKGNISHEIASCILSTKILEESAFNKEEIKLIKKAILSHRNSSIKNNNDLLGVLYRADKLSRECYNCDVNSLCRWEDEKKNKTAYY